MSSEPQTLKISLTTLDSFREWVEKQPPYQNQDKFLGGIREGFKNSTASIRGSAAHKVTEIGYEHFKGEAKNQFDIINLSWTEDWPEVCTYQVDTEFQSLCNLERIRRRWLTPDAKAEPYAKLVFDINVDDVIYRIRIGMRIDLKASNYIVDYKNSSYPAGHKYGGSHSKYEDSLQWRGYLLATGMNLFYYQFIHMFERWPGKNIVSFEDAGYTAFSTDPQSMQKIEYWSKTLVKFCIQHGVLEHLIYKPKPNLSLGQ